MKGRRYLIYMLLLLFYSLVFSENVVVESEKYFSESYLEARVKFIESVIMAEGEIESLKNPNIGVDGEELYTDIALLGPEDAKNFLVLISGTHGVEGFAGSGIQNALLQEGVFNNLPQDTAVLIIHALNPYGFSHIRRFDENNIDPNRNFLNHTCPHPANPGYDKLEKALTPDSISLASNTASIFKLLFYGIRYGFNELRTAVSGGQYTDPDGLFYGGNIEAWANTTLEYAVKKYLSQSQRVVVMDLHTGLGDYGECEIIMNVADESPAYIRAREIWDEKVKTTYKGDSVSIHLTNTLKLAVEDMAKGVEVTAVSPEFGTVSPLRVFWALRSENWLHHHGGKGHPKAEKIKEKLLRAFYPDDTQWKLKVLEHGRNTVEEALTYLHIEDSEK